VLPGKGHVQLTVYIPNAEGRVSQWDADIGKTAHGGKISVEHVYESSAEIGREQDRAHQAVANRQPFVNRAVGGVVDFQQGLGRIHAGIPRGNRSIFRGEDESCWHIGSQSKFVCTVKYDSRRGPRGASQEGRRYLY